MVSGLSIGTPRYMSPEQVQGLEVDARSDLFSAGVMLYELLTSALPFEGVHPMAVVAKILHVAHAPVQGLRPEVPPALAAVVDKALSKNPDHRYQTAQTFSAALVQACEGVLPLERLTQVTGGSGALALVEPESGPKLMWLLQGEPAPEAAQDLPGATTGASLAAAAAYAATTVATTQGQAQGVRTYAGTSPTHTDAAKIAQTGQTTTTPPAYQATSLTPAPAITPPIPSPSAAQMRPDDTTLSMEWEATSVGASSDFQATVLDVAPSSFSPTPTAPHRRRISAWWLALLAVPALGLAAWLTWGRSSAPPALPPAEVAVPNTPSEPKEEVISTTSSAPLTPGAITPPPLTPPPSPTANTPATTAVKPATKPKTESTPTTSTPEPTPSPPPPPPPPPPEPKPEPVKPPPPPKEPCQDKEGFFARESCLWDACKLPTYRQMQVCARFNHPKPNPN
jgi:hypothetical protein